MISLSGIFQFSLPNEIFSASENEQVFFAGESVI
jgi:hypothetical protein